MTTSLCSWCSATLPERPVEVRAFGGAVTWRFCSRLCKQKSDSMIESYDEPVKKEDGDDR